MDKRPGVLPELVIPVGAILFGLYYLSTVWMLPFQAKVVGLYVTAGIAILCVILGFRFARELRSGEKGWTVNGFFSDAVTERRRWGVLGVTVLFIALMPVLGFALSLFLFVLSTVLLVGGMTKIRAALVVAASITVIAFSIFILFVKVRFPLSAIDEAIRSLVQ